MFDNRRYVIIPESEINKIDFTEVLETAPETCRYSVDGTKTFVKYEGEMPVSVSDVTDKSQEYTHSQILELLAGPEWTLPVEEI